MTSLHPYRGLRNLLYALAVIEALAGLVLIFGTSWVLSMAPATMGLANAGFVGLFFKAIGIIAIGLGYLLCVAGRDPVRYVAIIDTLAFILIASAILLAYALGAMHLSQYFPANYMVLRIIIGIIIAIVLISLRPRAPRASHSP